MRTLLLTLIFAAPLAVQEKTDPVAAIINRHLDARWKEKGLTPSAAADDYEFFRRLSLDVLGRVPKPDEIKAFVNDASPAKRAAAVDRLLATDEAANFFADRWLRLLWGYHFEETDPFKVDFPKFVGWLQKAYKDDLAYDQFATSLIAPTGELEDHPEANFAIRHLDPKEPPVALANRVTRVFLGLQMQCAQCHDHPTDPITQDDFWGVTACFGGIKKRTRKTFDGIKTKIIQDAGATVQMMTDTEKPTQVTPRFLDGTKPADGEAAAAFLAKKVVGYKDDRFAQAAVNRLWSLYMGRGFVDPMDRFNERTKPSHPELLAELAADFRTSGFKLRRVMRGILLSKAYGLASKRNDAPENEFAFKMLRPQDPPQLLNNLMLTLALDVFIAEFYKAFTANKDLPEGYRNATVFRLYLFKFMESLLAPGGHAPEEVPYAGSVRMALKLMNGHDLQGLMKAFWGRLGEILKADQAPEGRVDLIWLTTLSRPPTADERERALAHIRKKRGEPSAYEDLYWSLINSTEFFFNH